MLHLVSTAVIGAFLLISAASYIFHPATIDGVRNLGFPDFFRVQLAVMKVLATIVLLLPWFPLQMKEWAYVGVALFLITAFIAHFAHGDPWYLNAINVILFITLVASYARPGYFHGLS